MRPSSGWGSGSGKQLMLPPRLLGEEEALSRAGPITTPAPGIRWHLALPLGFFFGTVPWAGSSRPQISVCVCPCAAQA